MESHIAYSVHRVGMWGKPKFGSDWFLKKTNLPIIRHTFRWFSDRNWMQSAIQIKWLKVTLLALNVQIKNVLKHDRNRV